MGLCIQYTVILHTTSCDADEWGGNWGTPDSSTEYLLSGKGGRYSEENWEAPLLLMRSWLSCVATLDGLFVNSSVLGKLLSASFGTKKIDDCSWLQIACYVCLYN